ncbi:MAG: Nif3-like dinuclear metal center hexameric protein [Lachnospiraceae bacterium]|nr:Nif3-like dinuclear metal center hexameric protein [Lachnospiraceae bacterium]MEE1014991.1 Nif3-like dinuclear metal center hexameric protein [Lachnospiraceae bacterium]
MKCKEIIQVLEEACPLKYAESWDNTGFQIGDREKDVAHIFVAMDVTDENIAEAIRLGADMMVTHHPMLFSPLSSVTTDSINGRRVIKLIENGICYMSTHTNYDSCRMADLAAERLALTECEVLEEVADGIGIGKVGKLPEKMTLRECALYVKKVFDIPSVRFFGDGEQKVTVAAICPGAGKSLVKECHGKGAEVYITGDIDHHTGIDQVDDALPIIDAGHYGVEHIYIEDMYQLLSEKCPEIKVSKAEIKHPFEVV